MDYLTISIVTVTFNAEALLPGLIESMRAQTDREFEWVIVDGSSTDGTLEIIKMAGDVVSKWISEPDFGIYDAMNKAVHLSNGEYYLVLGADDRLFPEAVSLYRKYARNANADIVTATVITDTNQIFPPGLGQAWRRGLNAYISSHSVGALIKKALHEEVGYYSNRFPIAADQLFIKRVAARKECAIVLADFVAGMQSLGGTSVVDVLGMMLEFFRVQVETGENVFVQTLLLVHRTIRHRKVLRSAIKSRRASYKQGLKKPLERKM